MRNTALFGSIVLGLAVLVAACADLVTEPAFSVHPGDFVQASVHGKMVLESPNEAESCKSCHGEDLRGGRTGESCYRCHAAYPHPDGFGKTGAAGFHAAVLQEERAWDITGCTSCHGEDYAGQGHEAKNCRSCHAQGPTACNTCHGSEVNAAPPEALGGQDSPSAPSVGLHQAHLGEGDVADLSAAACVHCHPAVDAFTAATHLDAPGQQGPADVVFSALATQNGRTTPVWDPVSRTCSDVYCHGSFAFLKEESRYGWGYGADAITGSDLTVHWTEPEAADLACGSCHGLPPEGHRQPDDRVPVSECTTCHPRVVDADLRIVDKTLHVNGRVDVF